VSDPSLAVITINFTFWFVLAYLSFHVWRWGRANKTTLARATSSETISAFWGLTYVCFVFGLAQFFLDLYWIHATAKDLYRSAYIAAKIFPVFGLTLFALVFIVQIVLSRPYSPWHRLTYCATPLVLIFIVSLSCRSYAWRGKGDMGWIPIAAPIDYVAATSNHLSELVGMAGDILKQQENNISKGAEKH